MSGIVPKRRVVLSIEGECVDYHMGAFAYCLCFLFDAAISMLTHELKVNRKNHDVFLSVYLVIEWLYRVRQIEIRWFRCSWCWLNIDAFEGANLIVCHGWLFSLHIQYQYDRNLTSSIECRMRSSSHQHADFCFSGYNRVFLPLLLMERQQFPLSNSCYSIGHSLEFYYSWIQIRTILHPSLPLQSIPSL